MVDFAEKIDKFRENEIPVELILKYYVDFIWYFEVNFISISFFSCYLVYIRLANNSEITAILSSGISFKDFSKPYLISSLVVVIFALVSVMFIVQTQIKTMNLFLKK